MDEEYFSVLSCFDEKEPKFFINGEPNSVDNHPEIVNQLMLQGLIEEKYNTVSLIGYVLTDFGGKALDDEIKERSKPMSSKEVTNKILEYCCKYEKYTAFNNTTVYRKLLIPKNLFELTLKDMEAKDFVVSNLIGFRVKPAGCLFWNDGGYKKEGIKPVLSIDKSIHFYHQANAIVNQDSSFEDSPITQIVTNTPNTKDRAHIKSKYGKTLFKDYILPVLVILTGTFLIWLIKYFIQHLH